MKQNKKIQAKRMDHKTKQRIKQIIGKTHRYNSLNLFSRPEQWYLVLIEYHNHDWSALKTLKLNKCSISDFGVVELFKKAKILWTELQVLQLNNNLISNLGVEHIMNQQWNELVSLKLQQNKITSQSLLIVFSKETTNLSILNLSNNSLKYTKKTKPLQLKYQQDIRQKFELSTTNLQIENKIINKLTKLRLNKCVVDIKFIKLLRVLDLKLLQQVQLQSVNLGNEGIKNLVKNQWPDLKLINLNRNRIKYDSYQYFHLSNWKNIEFISISKISKIFWSPPMIPIGIMNFTRTNWQQIKHHNIQRYQLGINCWMSSYLTSFMIQKFVGKILNQ